MIHMQKNIFLFLLLVMTGAKGMAQDTTLTYERQRQKVNRLLEQRSERFGAFDESLRKKTGIFGILKRKKDWEASIDILKEIVRTDNDLFKETKTLLDFKDVQRMTYEEKATSLNERVKGYMLNITKMQKERAQLQTALTAAEEESHTYFLVSIMAFCIIIFLSYLLLKKKKLTKR